MINAAVLMVALACPTEVRPEFVRLFEAREFRFSGRVYRDRVFPYRLFIPDQPDAARKYPLVVWLHGGTKGASDNVSQLNVVGGHVFRAPWNRRDYPFFLLAVPRADDNSWWYHDPPAETADDMIDVVMAIADQVVREFPIDPDRVSVVGVSTGATGCWELAQRYPDRFSAVAPIAFRGGDVSRIDKLLATPVWAFVSQGDGDGAVARTRHTVESLQAAGGLAHLTEVDSPDHDCWTAALSEYHLIEWLLAQRRGKPSFWYGPGSISWQGHLRNATRGWRPWQIIAQLVVVAFPIVVVWRAIRRRRAAS